MVPQTRIVSLIEVILNTSLGFVVSFCAWPFVAHLFGYEYSLSSNLAITAIFTVLSIARGYVVRRFFARDLHQFAMRLGRRLANGGG